MTNTTLYTLLFSLLLAGAYASDSFLVLKGTERFAFDTIPQNNVADLIAHVNGFSSVHACADRTGYPEIDPFAQPKANILVVIDAVSQDDLASEPRDFFDTTNAVEILKQAYPEDSLSVLTGIMTGEDWESHGIVGSSWKATDYLGVKAFSQRGQCKVPTLLDVLTHASEGTTRSVIFSGNQNMGTAMGIHNELLAKNPDWNSRVVVYSEKAGIIDLYSQKSLASNSVIRKASKDKMMTIETREGFVLAAELFAIENLPSLLPEGEFSSDFIGIGLYSMKSLVQRFGRDSEQFKVALRLLDDALSKMYTQLNAKYDSQVFAQVIGLGTAVTDHTSRNQVEQQKKYLQVDEQVYYNTTYSADAVSAFQTQLWTAVAIIIAVLIGIMYLVKMDMLYDSVLYKTTDGPRPIADVK